MKSWEEEPRIFLHPGNPKNTTHLLNSGFLPWIAVFSEALEGPNLAKE